MNDFMKTLSTAASGMGAQSDRLRVVSENVANADTPGYRRKTISFEAAMDPRTNATTVEVGRVKLSDQVLEETFDPSHPMADERGIVQMSNVSLMTEIADAREAQRSYDANMNIFDQARKMYGGVLDLLRR